jgi:hypothetical protein
MYNVLKALGILSVCLDASRGRSEAFLPSLMIIIESLIPRQRAGARDAGIEKDDLL